MSNKLQIIRFPHSQFGSVEYPRGGSYGPVTQSEYQLFAMQAGGAEVFGRGESYTIEAGHCRLLPVNESFRIRFYDDLQSKHTWCMLSDDLIQSSGLKGFLTERTVAISHQMNLLMLSALDLESSEFLEKSVYFDRLGECVFREYIRLTGRLNRSSAEISIEKVLNLMHQHLSEPLCVGELAKSIGMSRQHFSKVFKEMVGTPVATYLWELRVKKAHVLLCQTGLSLSEIAENTGFQNPFHLSRRIKAFYGLSPTAIRNGQ